MGKETERSAEMRRVLEEYGASGLRRREFCQQRGITLTTFDYWRREHAVKPPKQERRPRMVKVKVANERNRQPHFALSLANGRRIECSWAVCRCGTGASDSHRRKRVMFGLGLATKIFIALEAIDMRKGFEGLHGLVRDHWDKIR